MLTNNQVQQSQLAIGSSKSQVHARPHLRSRPGKGANIVQGGQELAVHDLGQAHIRNLGCVVTRQQDVGRLQIKVHNLPGVQEVQPPCNVQSYSPAEPWCLRTVRSLPAHPTRFQWTYSVQYTLNTVMPSTQ